MRLALALIPALVLAALVLTTSPALAQDPPTSARAPRGTTEVTRYEFVDGDRIEGDRYSPDGDVVRAGRRAGRRTLIRARAHFVPEILVSVERL
jgi:hypothetical protein